MIDFLIKAAVCIYLGFLLLGGICLILIGPVLVIGCIYSCCTGKLMPWMKDQGTTFKGTVSFKRKEEKDENCTIEEKWW